MENVKFDRGGYESNYPPRRIQKESSIEELLSTCPKNQIIADNLIRAWSKINNPKYEKIVCSISGGSDSDVMLDIVWRCDKDNKVDYVWFDTGLEYQATKEHLKYLEKRYGIKILTHKARKPIPICCKEYGQPFISKHVSEMMSRLIRHNFSWEDRTFDVLYKEFPACKVALLWWTNSNISDQFNIRRNKFLKEFIIQNPPTFTISNKCCYYAKKKVSHDLINENDYGLSIIGVRRAEGGTRSVAYKSCFDEDGTCDNYRPLFWYKDSDKREYVKAYAIENSKCYTEYGLTRTGCAGCPFSRDFEKELEIIKEFEPKLFKAANNIFGDSYEYTRKYWEFRRKKEEENR